MQLASACRVLLRPRRCCVLCGQPAGRSDLCGGCAADLPWIVAACERCGRPLSAVAGAGACGRCDIRTTGVDGLLAAVVYEYPVPWLIGTAKFRRQAAAARALGLVLAGGLARRGWATAEPRPALVPVPLHPARLAVRGFNQSAEMAGVLARRCDLTVLSRACRRIRHTPPQTGLSGTARRLNLHDAFRVDGDVRGLSLAIVDDVVTTGATVSSLARALKAAGAARVEVWCAARVVGPATRPRLQGRKV